MSYQQRKVIRALRTKYGFRFLREGAKHIIYVGPHGQQVQVPRHKEIKRGTVGNIAAQAGIDAQNFRKEVA